jgi:ABC-type glycerol-3-phosphate transport system substrate-binding protein
MGWFRRSKQSDHTAVPEEAAGVSVPDTDWADLEAVLAEWREDPEPPDWGRAMEMFEEGPVPAQRLNVAEYLTRRLKLALFDRTALPDWG